MDKSDRIQFLKSFIFSTIVMLCVIFGAMASMRCYENIRNIAYGEQVEALELLADGTVNFFDANFDISFIKNINCAFAAAIKFVSPLIRLLQMVIGLFLGI